ncbi:MULTISPECIES: hypothetical protein [unclassified Nocardioides]|uniref:hypothetical protein n=1 Tax=unclassified Nocardioides TaxID=2615069 RepID=UPI0006F3CDD6|nr:MULTISPECIES: hypothetical protein [unclassified Nocardioides]KRA38727.1 hypothetical protein ASD81_09020 [Nocardioides sp. Root614]KRA92687.1 hypothetical protein ASD84_09285 [Nocardioides sp. Root682]
MADIGGRLIADGLVEPSQLATARDRQRREGGFLGNHLISAGFLSRGDFYAALVDLWRSEQRDLLHHPPQPELLAELDVEETVELGWIACDLFDDTVVVATSVPPAEELVVEVQEHFPGRDVEFVACTQHDLDAVAMGVRRQRAGADRASPAPIVRLRHHLLALAIAMLAVAAGFVLPIALVGWTLLVAVVVFVVGALVSSKAGYPVLVNDLRAHPRAELRVMASLPFDLVNEPVPADQGLPVYTVIVRLTGGDRALQALLENFSVVDYPWARTDAILLVADSDLETLGALRRTTRRAWTRVVRVPDADFRDPVRAYDHGLALARGRYLVAWEQDETPARDQVRRAVAAFERDLEERVDRRDAVPPLLALRVARRISSARTTFGRLTAADEALRLDHGSGAASSSGREPNITSVHCNMRLLRRFGGFASLVRRPTMERVDGAVRPRIEELDSTSTRAAAPGPLLWTSNRAESTALILLDTVVQVRSLARLHGPRRAERARVRALAIGLGTAAMFLAYPFVLVGSLLATVRSRRVERPPVEPVAWLGLAAAVLVLLVAVSAAWLVLARRRGWRVGFAALALPAHWFLHSLAVWSALVAVLLQPSLHRHWPSPKR